MMSAKAFAGSAVRVAAAAARATCSLMLNDGGRVRIHLSDEEIAKIETMPDFIASQIGDLAEPG